MQIGVETSKAVDQRRVFVVDEDEITRAALQFMLQDEIETHELASPVEAFEKGTGWLKPGAPEWCNAGIYIFQPVLFEFTARLVKSPRGESFRGRWCAGSSPYWAKPI